MNGPQIQFFGRLTRDPELRYTANDGTPFTTLGIAVNTNLGPDRPQETNFFDVTLWRRHAERAANRCTKGTPVFVQGRFNQEEYARRDGSTGYALRVSATSFRIDYTDPQPPTAEQLNQVDNLPADAPNADPTPDLDPDLDPDPAEGFDLSEDII